MLENATGAGGHPLAVRDPVQDIALAFSASWSSPGRRAFFLPAPGRVNVVLRSGKQGGTSTWLTPPG